MRCAWCKRFIRNATPLTCWRALVPGPNRQRADDEWNYWARYLCPACAPAIQTLWHRQCTFEEVLVRRPEGLPVTHENWQEPRQDSPLQATAPALMFGVDRHEKVRL